MVRIAEVSHNHSLTGAHSSVAEVWVLSGSFQTACFCLPGHFMGSDLGVMVFNIWTSHNYPLVPWLLLTTNCLLISGAVGQFSYVFRLCGETCTGEWEGNGVWPEDKGLGTSQACCHASFFRIYACPLLTAFVIWPLPCLPWLHVCVMYGLWSVLFRRWIEL